MRRGRGILLGGIMVTMVLFGCKEGAQGPAGPALTGNLHGKVVAFDSLGISLGLASGVQVSAEGTGFAGISDSLGEWVITGLPTGTYNIDYSKAGYGSAKTVQFQFVGGADYYIAGTVSIVGLPHFEADTAIASIAAGSLNVTGTVTGGTPAYQRRVIVYIGKANSISSTIPSSYVTAGGPTIAPSTNAYSFSTSTAALMSSYGFKAGDSIYVAVYSLSTGTQSGYNDPASGHNVYTSIGTVGKRASVAIP